MSLDDVERVGAPDGLDRGLPRLLDDGPSHLVVDLSDADPLSSGAVSALLHLHDRCRSRGLVMMLRRPSRRNLGVLRRGGLLAVLPIERSGTQERTARGDQVGSGDQVGRGGQPMSALTTTSPPTVVSNRSGSREA